MRQNKRQKLLCTSRRGINLTAVLFLLSLSLAYYCAHVKFIMSLFAEGQKEFVYEAKGKRNPFIPVITPDGRILSQGEENKSRDLSIEGIIYEKYGRSYALVNGSVVAVGDSIQDYEVLRIEENKVIFIKEGEIKVVAMHNEEGED